MNQKFLIKTSSEIDSLIPPSLRQRKPVMSDSIEMASMSTASSQVVCLHSPQFSCNINCSLSRRVVQAEVGHNSDRLLLRMAHGQPSQGKSKGKVRVKARARLKGDRPVNSVVRPQLKCVVMSLCSSSQEIAEMRRRQAQREQELERQVVIVVSHG